MTVKKVFVYVLLTLIVVGIFLFLYYCRGKIVKILTPFFIAMIIAYLVNPLAVKLERKRIPKRIGILLVYLFIVLSFCAIAIYVVPTLISNARDFINTLPQIILRFQDMLNDVISSIKSSKLTDEMKNLVYQEIKNGTEGVQELAVNSLRKSVDSLIGVVGMLFDITVAAVIAYYLLKDGASFRQLLLSLFPKKWRNGLMSTGKELNCVIEGFIQGQLLTALIVGALESLSLLLIGVKYPLILGSIGGLANGIPYFGPLIGAVPAVVVALSQSPAKALWTFAAFSIVQQMDSSLISPRIIEGKVGLHPVVTILSVLIGGEFFGIVGMFFAVPVAAMLKVLVKRVVEAIV